MSRRHPGAPSERDLAAFADGSLEPERREQVERAVADSPELQAELRDQRHALDAVRAASAERAPAALRERVRAARAERRPPHRIRALTVATAAGVAAVAAALVLTLGGGDSTENPTVADAAVLATRSPVDSVRAPSQDAATLVSPRAAGLRFPYWEEHFGWKATGSRRDRIDGRTATTVFYRHRGQAVAYTIVGGRPLPAGAHARRTVRDRTALRTLTVRGRPAVTWLRAGRTCVLSGTGTTHAALLRLAAWRGGGDILF